jgi:D-lyxose ketol-isomerase
MITTSQLRSAQEWSYDIFKKAGIPIREDERDKIEIADFGLNEFQKQGMHLFTMIATNRYAAKALALAPLQTEPEHWHPRIDDDPGKQETIRAVYGTLYFYIPGDDTLKNGFVPVGREKVFTCRHEIVMRPGDQLTLEPGQKHWFQAGPEGAVRYTFSSTARDVLDGFTDPEIKRVTEVVEDS